MEAVDSLLRAAATDPFVVSFAGGLPAPELFPRKKLLEAAFTLLGDREFEGASLQYAWPEGEASLRSWVAERLLARGMKVDPDDVLITAGAQQALSLSAELLLREGDTVRVGRLSYPAALDEFRARGATTRSGGRDASCIYVMPGVSNPTGEDTLREELDELLRIGRPLIADEAYSELRFDGVIGPPLLTMARDRVFHVGTISKTVCPGLRIGWLVPPPQHVEDLRHRKQLCDLQTATLSQAMFAEFLRSASYDDHVARARHLYAIRAAALASQLASTFPEWTFVRPIGGFSIYVETNLFVDDVTFLRSCTAHGVACDPGSAFLAEPASEGRLRLRLCYSALDVDEAREGVRRLASVCDEFQR